MISSSRNVMTRRQTYGSKTIVIWIRRSRSTSCFKWTITFKLTVCFNRSETTLRLHAPIKIRCQWIVWSTKLFTILQNNSWSKTYLRIWKINKFTLQRLLKRAHFHHQSSQASKRPQISTVKDKFIVPYPTRNPVWKCRACLRIFLLMTCSKLMTAISQLTWTKTNCSKISVAKNYQTMT